MLFIHIKCALNYDVLLVTWCEKWFKIWNLIFRIFLPLNDIFVFFIVCLSCFLQFFLTNRHNFINFMYFFFVVFWAAKKKKKFERQTKDVTQKNTQNYLFNNKDVKKIFASHTFTFWQIYINKNYINGLKVKCFRSFY